MKLPRTEYFLKSKYDPNSTTTRDKAGHTDKETCSYMTTWQMPWGICTHAEVPQEPWSIRGSFLAGSRKIHIFSGSKWSMRPCRVSGHQSQKEECSVFREGRNLPDWVWGCRGKHTGWDEYEIRQRMDWWGQRKGFRMDTALQGAVRAGLDRGAGTHWASPKDAGFIWKKRRGFT